MKICSSLLIAIVLTACNGVSQSTIKSTESTKAWQTKIVRKQKHTYNRSGLLDTTYRVEDYYVNGQMGSRMNFLIVRNYDKKDNLTQEKIFQFVGNKKILSEETLFEYDTQNNLILRKNIFENVLGEISKFKYNDLKQKVQEINIQKEPDIIPENWNMDSVLAHHSDKKIHNYDTLAIAYKYNESGDIIKQVYKKQNKIVTKIVTLFSKNQKAFIYGINSKGDTVSITKFHKDKNIIVEINNDKMNELYTDTTIFNEGRKLQSISINKKFNYRHKETFKYDEKGNESEFISFD